jgi:hypothetical protein
MANAFDINDTIETDVLDEHMPEQDTRPVRLLPKGKRVKRTEQEMKASFKGDPLSEAAYVRRRIASLEEKISQLLTCATPEARDLILNTKALEHLKRYY